MYRLSSESDDFNIERIIYEPPKLGKKISINVVFDADEFVLYYKFAPLSCIGPSRLAGNRKKKNGSFCWHFWIVMELRNELCYLLENQI